MKTCENCHNVNNDSSYFCHNCGSLLGFNGEYKDVYSLSEFKIARILDNLRSNVPHTKILLDDTVDLYTRKIEKCRALLNLPEMHADRNLVGKMNNFLELCRKQEFQIAFVGTIKTGKSTLINALLGSNYASMAVTPETAALTKFRSSPRDYVRVTFYSQKEWDKLWASRTSGADKFMQEYNELGAEEKKADWIGHREEYKEFARDKDVREELKRWSSSQSAEHYFVKEIEVGISTLPKSIPENVVFVDTPGLSDPVAYRSEITKGYISRANAVFVCVDAQKIQLEEMQTISSVFAFSSHDKNKVYIIATHYDTLNDPKKDWAKQKAYLEKQFVGPAFFDTREQAQSHIKPSAAYIYNLCRDFAGLEKEQKKPLQRFAISLDLDLDSLRESLPDMVRESGIDEIAEVINKQLASNYRELLLKDIKRAYGDIMVSLKRLGEERCADEKSVISATDASIEELENKLEKHKKDFEKIRNDSGQLKKFVKIIQTETDKRIEYVVENLEKLAKK